MDPNTKIVHGSSSHSESREGSEITNTISPFVHPKFIFHPAIAVVKNIPKAIWDGETFKLPWLSNSLQSLEFHPLHVKGFTGRHSRQSHGIIYFGPGEHGLTQVLFLERCFEVKGKGRSQWYNEPARHRKGIYMWAADAKDLLDVEEYVHNLTSTPITKETLEVLDMDAQMKGNIVVEIITAAMEHHQQQIMQGHMV